MARLTTSIVLAAILAASAPSTASAQVYAQQVWNQLQATYETLSDSYSLWHYVMGSLGDDADDTWSFSMSSGTQYLVMAACDADCSDIDLHLTDANGNEVASDVSADDVPVVVFTPASSGRVNVKVSMYECSSEPCYWGFAIYRQ